MKLECGVLGRARWLQGTAAQDGGAPRTAGAATGAGSRDGDGDAGPPSLSAPRQPRVSPAKRPL